MFEARSGICSALPTITIDLLMLEESFSVWSDSVHRGSIQLD
jgi:hypothetical protein